MAPPASPLLEHPSNVDTEPQELGVGGYSSVFQNKNFMTLWVGQIFSQLGDRIVLVVFIAVIASHYGTNDSYNSYLYIAFTIPAILLTAIAGVFVDRWPRRAVLVSTNLMRAAVVAFLPFASKFGLWQIYLLAFLLSAATQFFVPAEAATIPMIVKKQDLMAANSIFTTTMMASVILGFALGDPLINMFSLKEVHWSIVGFFVLSALILTGVKTPPQTHVEAPRKIATTLQSAFHDFFTDLKDGFLFIHNHKMVRNSIFLLAMMFSGVVAMCFLFITYAKAYLYEDPTLASRKFGYIIAFSGIGMALGAGFIGGLSHRVRRSTLVFTGFTVCGLSLLGLNLIPIGIPNIDDIAITWPSIVTPWGTVGEVPVTQRMAWTYGLSWLMGIMAAWIAVPLQALIHELIPEDKRGKVLGVQFTVLSTCSTLPVIIAGLGTESLGVTPILIMIGLVFLVLGIIGTMQLRRKPHVHSTNW